MGMVAVDREPFEWRDILNGQSITDDLGSRDTLIEGEMRDVGHISVGEWSGDRQDQSFNRGHGLSNGQVKLVLLTSGRASITQNGRTASLVPGDFAVVDAAAPHLLSFKCRFRCVVVLMESALFPVRQDDLRRALALRVSGHHGTGRMATQFLLSVAQEAFQKDRAGSHDLANALVNVVSASLHDKLHDCGPGDWSIDDRSLIHRIRAYIESRLGDPELTPVEIARAHHISVRYLQRIFESEGTTVSDWIRRQRLERCRAELIDPRHCRTSISAIAARWGFPDSSYFSRVFKATYLATPRAVRADALH